MAEEEFIKVELHDAFYRDSISKIVITILGFVTSIVLLIGVCVFLYMNQPPPVVFPVSQEWRVQPPVPLDQRYKQTPELLQWVANAILGSWVYDYINYNDQLNEAKQYFTADGWQKFLNQLNIYANYNKVQSNRLFVNGSPAGAPFIVKEGLLSGRYAWWIQMPITIKYQGMTPPTDKNITLQILVVRLSTLNDLDGIAIDDVIVAQPGTGVGAATVKQ